MAEELNSRDIHSRVSRLETSVENIAEGMLGMGRKLDALSETIGKSHRWDWAAIWGGMAVLVVVIGAVGRAYLSPLESTQGYITAEIRESKAERDKLAESINRCLAMTEKLGALTGAKLTEVETQFDWLNDVVNMRDRTAHVLTSIIWESEFKKPLPDPSLPEAGPGAKQHNRAHANGFHQ